LQFTRGGRSAGTNSGSRPCTGTRGRPNPNTGGFGGQLPGQGFSQQGAGQGAGQAGEGQQGAGDRRPPPPPRGFCGPRPDFKGQGGQSGQSGRPNWNNRGGNFGGNFGGGNNGGNTRPGFNGFRGIPPSGPPQRD